MFYFIQNYIIYQISIVFVNIDLIVNIMGGKSPKNTKSYKHCLFLK